MAVWMAAKQTQRCFYSAGFQSISVTHAKHIVLISNIACNKMTYLFYRVESFLVLWSIPCEVSETLTASWLLKELTPIMPPCEAVLPRDGIWLWLRGTLYRASAISAALFRMISYHTETQRELTERSQKNSRREKWNHSVCFISFLKFNSIWKQTYTRLRCSSAPPTWQCWLLWSVVMALKRFGHSSDGKES